MLSASDRDPRRDDVCREARFFAEQEAQEHGELDDLALAPRLARLYQQAIDQIGGGSWDLGADGDLEYFHKSLRRTLRAMSKFDSVMEEFRELPADRRENGWAALQERLPGIEQTEEALEQIERFAVRFGGTAEDLFAFVVPDLIRYQDSLQILEAAAPALEAVCRLDDAEHSLVVNDLGSAIRSYGAEFSPAILASLADTLAEIPAQVREAALGLLPRLTFETAARLPFMKAVAECWGTDEQLSFRSCMLKSEQLSELKASFDAEPDPTARRNLYVDLSRSVSEKRRKLLESLRVESEDF